MKKALISAVIWAIVVEAVFIVLKMTVYPGVSVLGVQIGIVLTTIAEYFITLNKQKSGGKKR